MRPLSIHDSQTHRKNDQEHQEHHDWGIWLKNAKTKSPFFHLPLRDTLAFSYYIDWTSTRSAVAVAKARGPVQGSTVGHDQQESERQRSSKAPIPPKEKECVTSRERNQAEGRNENNYWSKEQALQIGDEKRNSRDKRT